MVDFDQPRPPRVVVELQKLYARKEEVLISTINFLEWEKIISKYEKNPKPNRGPKSAKINFYAT